MPGTELVDEDAWLNDTLMPPLQPRDELHPETPAQPATPTLASEEEAPASSQAGGQIIPGHRLWPVVLSLSQRLWQDRLHKGGIVAGRDHTQVELIKKRCLDMLRAEPTLASQVYNLTEAEQVLKGVVDEVLGYGPLEPLLKDEAVTEIMAVGPCLTYIERNGDLQEAPYHFEDERHMTRIVENILRQAGRDLEPHWPLADIRLPDGTFVNIVMPPGAVKGPAITIRKRKKRPLELADLVHLGSLSPDMADFLHACVQARLNIVICGGMRSGRTTLLNALANCIPEGERIVTIENAAELDIKHKHAVALEAYRSALDANTRERVTMRDLVVNALHMRPERIIVDECRGDEAMEMLHAMGAGQDGSLITLYANNLQDGLNRLEMLWLVDRSKVPVALMRAQVAQAVHLLIHQARLSDGSRKIMNIAEVQGVEGDRIKLQSIFHFEEAGGDETIGAIRGTFEPGGFRPTCMSKLEAKGIYLSDEVFVRRGILEISR